MSKPRPSGPRAELQILRLMALLGLAAVFLLARPAAAALTCDRAACGPFLQGSVGHTSVVCFFPAAPVTQELWGELQPVDSSPLPAERDTTAFNEFDTTSAGLYFRNNWFMGVDVENGWVLAGLAHGIGIWDARTTPANPTFIIEKKYDPSAVGGFPYIPGGEFSKFVFGAIDAPDDSLAVLAGYNGVGMLVFDLTDKGNPKPVYQNAGLDSSESVYATTIGGTRYAFVAAKTSGLNVYNLDNARTFSNGCGEGGEFTGSCPGVKLSPIPVAGASFVHGAGNYVAVSGGGKVQIFDVSNPAAPVSRLLTTLSTQGIALWNQGASYYLAARIIGGQTAIYDVSCINGGSCGGLGGSLWTGATDTQSSSEYITFSRSSGGTPFLYVGGDAPCVGSLDTQQHEWLFDVSSPSAPHDVSPQGTILRTAAYNGVDKTAAVGYWTWYYRPSPTGFDYVSPRAGKFSGDYFFRAAKSIFDIHKLARNSPPAADFTWSPSQIYPGTPVTFSDRSSGAPIQWSWTFTDGTPSTATAQNPQVTFGSAGSKAVTLSSFNALGRGDTSKNVTVLDPNPQGSVAASPAPVPPAPLTTVTVCQQVTLTANATGAPPLSYTWEVLDPGNLRVAGPTDGGTSFAWASPAGAQPGVYTGKVTVKNSFNLGGVPLTKQFQVDALPALTDISGAAPTTDAFTNNFVHFQAPTHQGATKWVWDYGDGVTETFSDAVQGKSPTHTYAAIGLYSAKVTISNCANQTGFTSQAVAVNVIQTTPLKAAFQGGFCQFGSCFGTAGVPVSFVDTSTGAEKWDYDWSHAANDANCNFTDNDHTSPVTTHTFTTPGTYYPCLRVRRGASEHNEVVHVPLEISSDNGGGGGGGGGGGASITVSGAGAGQINQGVTFTASASGCTASPSGWSWSTGGGTGSSTTSSITITWTSAGPKAVTASNSGCGAVQGVKSVTITDPNGGGGGGGGNLQANFTSTPAPQPNQVVTFDGSSSTGSPTDWRWDFGDNSTGTGQSVTHTFANAGNYSVKLTVSKPSVGCPFAPCVSESSVTKVVVIGTPPPPLSAEFSANVDCVNVGGFDQCQAKTGQTVTLTADVTDATSYSWSFGDTKSGSGRSVTHAWTSAGPYAVTLTVVKGSSTASKTRTFNISGSPVARTKSVVLPWIAQTRGALLQSSDLYVNNPGTSPTDVTLEFRKRGTPDTNPPRVTRTIPAGATLYVADVLRELFNRENVAGFISVSVQGDVEPIITSFNTTFQPDGKQFGQTVAGVPMNATDSAAASGAGDQVQHLVGLTDNSDRLAYFGISNPGEAPATYHLTFFDKTGRQIGDSGDDLTLSRFGQRQFQTKEIHDAFGISNADDYRIEIETKSGGQIIPYASNLRLASEDPSFVEADASRAAKVFLVGVLSTPGLNNSLWQTDVLLANTSGNPVAADVTFTSVGNTSTPTSPLHLTLTPGETERLANVIAGQWGIKNAIGVVTITSAGDFPIVQGESYENTNPLHRFGQTMAAMSDADAASAGQSQLLVGLRQDANNRTTFWIFNPGTDTAEYDVVYRGLDGKVLGTTAGVRLGGGKLRQFSPSQHPLPAAGVANGFTVQIVVKSGKVLSAAQVINNLTNDPAYIKGEAR